MTFLPHLSGNFRSSFQAAAFQSDLAAFDMIIKSLTSPSDNAFSTELQKRYQKGKSETLLSYRMQPKQTGRLPPGSLKENSQKSGVGKSEWMPHSSTLGKMRGQFNTSKRSTYQN